MEANTDPIPRPVTTEPANCCLCGKPVDLRKLLAVWADGRVAHEACYDRNWSSVSGELADEIGERAPDVRQTDGPTLREALREVLDALAPVPIFDEVLASCDELVMHDQRSAAARDAPPSELRDLLGIGIDAFGGNAAEDDHAAAVRVGRVGDEVLRLAGEVIRARAAMIGYPKTITAALKEWDSGGAVWSVVMGGLGPGYEQAIQVTVIEMLRDALTSKVPKGDAGAFTASAEKTVTRINEDVLGLSGAQFHAALDLAFKFYSQGWKKTIESAPEDRRMQVSNRWPRVGAT